MEVTVLVGSGAGELCHSAAQAQTMRYHKFRWVLLPGDDHDHPEWGDSWWYYEFGPDGFVRHQIMLYDSGIRVRYGPDHMADEYGELLSDVRLDEVNLSMGQDIGAAEFEGVWQSGPWTNNAAVPGTAADRGGI